MKILSCEQMRMLEQRAVEGGIGYYRLMENAGISAAKAFVDRFNIHRGDRVVAVCGKGNNGGDGIVAATYLCGIGIRTDIILVDGEIKTAEAARALSESGKSNVPVWRIWEEPEKAIEKITNADYIIDAIYGIGFKGELRSNIRPVVELMNKSRGRIISVDTPSGAECDSGHIENGCVNADMTVSFTTLKPLHVLYPSMDFCGKTYVLDVGIPQRLTDESPFLFETVTRSLLKSVLKKRKPSSNKGSFGALLSICGSYGMAGAAQLASKGAYSCGVGLVRAAVADSVYKINAPQFPEAVYMPLYENESGRISAKNTDKLISCAESSSAVLIGCGLGIDGDTRALVNEIVKKVKAPLILDADALNIIAENPDVLNFSKSKIIVTPHPGEMARLCGTTVQRVQENRKACAEYFSKKYNVITVLKGAYTLISDEDGKCLVNTTGNPGMAKGGSGDVLAGIIAGLIAQGVQPFKAACAGVYIHGGAGDIALERTGEYSMLASDIINSVPEFLKGLV